MREFITIIVALMNIVSTHAEIPPDMLSWMNTSIHPCEDFYQYSCGGWIKTTTLKPSEIFLRAPVNIIERNKALVIHDIMEAKHPRLTEFWESCMNFDKITKLGNTPLLEDLKRIMNTKTKADVLELAGEFSRTGTHLFTTFSVRPGFIDAQTNTFHVSAAELTLPSISFYSQENFATISTEYREYINDLIKVSGYKSDNAADTVITMEDKLAALMIQDHHNKYNYMRLSTSMKTFPLTIGAFTKGLGIAGSRLVKKRIHIKDLVYFKGVEKLLHSLSLESLQLYVAFGMVHSRVEWLGAGFYQIWFKLFHQKMTGLERPRLRYSTCKKHLLVYIPDLIGQYYYEKVFNDEKKKEAMEMIELIKRAIGNHISESTWMKNKEKKKAIKKLKNVFSIIGQTERPQSYPSKLSYDDYPANIYRILSHSFDQKLNKVDQRVNRMEWQSSAAAVDAQYVTGMNTMWFPAAMLQAPHFDGDKVHPARNFGGIGFIMGHELTHGFDTVGSNYDGVGKFKPWWSDSSAKSFKNEAQCFENLYSSFEVKVDKGELKTVDGRLTLDENIADIGGAALAWDAYREYMTTKMPKTSGVSAEEGEQMFFIALGQSLCSKVRGEAMREELLTDVHSPAQWRVNGVVMNNHNFAKVFRCKPDAPMNPSKKCQIW